MSTDAPLVDAHLHLYTRDMPITDWAWHRPPADATAERFLSVMDAHGVGFGVVAAASLYGDYNDYTIRCLRRQPRLRGTAFVRPETDMYTLERMKADGIVGVRLFFRRVPAPPDLRSAEYRLLLRRVRDLGWHVHTLVESPMLPGIIAAMEQAGVKLVIDHMGHPTRRGAWTARGSRPCSPRSSAGGPGSSSLGDSAPGRPRPRGPTPRHCSPSPAASAGLGQRLALRLLRGAGDIRRHPRRAARLGAGRGAAPPDHRRHADAPLLRRVTAEGAGRRAMGGVTRRGLGVLGVGTGIAAAARPARAQAWPSRPVAVVVPFVPGGSADVLGRPLAQHLSGAFGQAFVVDNRGGANGNVGTHAVVRAEPDGQTLLVTTNGPVSTNTLLFRSMPYDPFTGLAPVALRADLPVVVVARREAPYASLREMIAHARANPGRIDCGVPATGALGHLAAELLQRRTGISWTIVPFRGGATAANGLLSGAVEVAVDLVPSYRAQIQAGTVRVFGVAARERLEAVPGAEPIAAQGLPGFEAAGWTAILGPAGLPGGIVRRLNEATNRFLAKPETRAVLAAVGSRVLGGTPEDLARKMRAEVALWRPVIADARISLE